jgi:hypothetical protein
MNDDLLKQGGSYFEELLERIRDARSSEKVFCRKVLEFTPPASIMTQGPKLFNFFPNSSKQITEGCS